MNDFDQSPPSLLRVKQQLAKDYDRLTEAWKEADEFLVAMHIGEEFHVLIFDECGDELHISNAKEGVDLHENELSRHWLGFCQWNGRWGIYYGRSSLVVSEPYDDHTEWRPILECSKEERLGAAEKLPELLAMAAEEAVKVRVRVGEAADIISRAVSAARMR